MSFADFDDIYLICSDWDREGMFEDIIMVRLNQLLDESLTYPMTSRLNRWGDIAEKEMLTAKRDGVLV